MDSKTKKFIEDNIELIEDNKWNEIFYSYINSPKTSSVWDLINILDDAHIDYYEEFLKFKFTKEQFIEILEKIHDMVMPGFTNTSRSIRRRELDFLKGKEALFDNIGHLGKQLGYDVYYSKDMFTSPAYFFNINSPSLEDFILELRDQGFRFNDDWVVKI